MNTEAPIRVLHILGSLQRGGTESVVFNNYRHIDRTKVQFDIVVDDNSLYDIPQSIKSLGCHVYRIPSYTKLPAYITAITEICRKNKYMIVHSHMNSMSVFCLFAAYLAKVPIRIVHSHSTAARGKGELWRNGLKYTLRPFSKLFATDYFACSYHAARWLFGNSHVRRGKVTILNNAVPTEKFTFSLSKRLETRRKLQISDKFVIGNVGRFSPPKNHLFLIDVFNAVTKVRSDAYLIHIGGLGSSGDRIERGMKAKIAEYGIGDRVRFLGTAEDISEFYQAMDVFVLPSLYEGLGIVSIEAQCSGLPCVLSDGVPKEAKINEEVRFLSLEETPEFWAKVITESKGVRGDYSKNLEDAGFDIKSVAKTLENTYLRCVMRVRR